ncbi:MAG: SseB family protein [Rhodobacteraceae bacterium]|nr:SseB family protein [Paracoccaceae bacterium]
MTEPTPLDLAHQAMQATPEDVTARLRYYGALAAQELFVLLAREAEGAHIAPQVFELDEGPVVLAFDSEARLGDFTGAPAPYAALPGRALAAMLAGQGLGLGVNLGADTGELLAADAVAWWAETLAPKARQMHAQPKELTPPSGLPEALLHALDARLGAAAGLAGGAWLAGVRYRGGGQGHLLAFLDIAPGAEDSLARLVDEALRFSGIEAGALDVAFLATGDAITTRLARVGLRIELPEPQIETPLPITDPDAPPRLR